MATKEVKEVSIESIKNEIADNLKNDLDILKCLGIDNLIFQTGGKQNISNICDTLISDYSNITGGNYITVEAEEHEFSVCNPNDHRRYKVIIRMGLEKEKSLDCLAALVKEVIIKLYPNRKNYSNVPFYKKKEITAYNTYETLNRQITFEIETN